MDCACVPGVPGRHVSKPTSTLLCGASLGCSARAYTSASLCGASLGYTAHACPGYLAAMLKAYFCPSMRSVLETGCACVPRPASNPFLRPSRSAPFPALSPRPFPRVVTLAPAQFSPRAFSGAAILDGTFFSASSPAPSCFLSHHGSCSLFAVQRALSAEFPKRRKEQWKRKAERRWHSG